MSTALFSAFRAAVISLSCLSALTVPAAAPAVARSVDGGSANELLYVADRYAQAIFIYRLPSEQKPFAIIKNSIADPGQIALDSQGNLYVTNSLTRNVTIYPPGSSAPTETVSRGLFSPAGVAVASDGTLYVSDYDGWFNVYEPKTHRLKRTVWLPVPTQMGFDGSGYLYVMYQKYRGVGDVMRYPPHSYKGRSLGVGATYAMGVDAAGNVAAADFNYSSGGSLALYAPPTYRGVADCTGGSEYAADFASGLAFDPLGKYMVAAIPRISGHHAQVSIYAYSIGESSSSCALVASIDRVVREPAGVVVGPDSGGWGGGSDSSPLRGNRRRLKL